MESILLFSVVLWAFLDRAKKLWAHLSWGKWLTTAIALGGGMAIAFGYGLDLLTALHLCPGPTWGGSLFAGLALAGGSSCLHELLEKVQVSHG